MKKWKTNKKEKSGVENYLLGLSDLKNRKDYKSYMKKIHLIPF